jgi:hypothetical protein
MVQRCGRSPRTAGSFREEPQLGPLWKHVFDDRTRRRGVN